MREPQFGGDLDAIGIEVGSTARALLEAQSDASGVALLVVADGQVWSYNDHFTTLWRIPEAVLADRSLGALKSWLAACGSEAAIALSGLLTERGASDSGEIAAADGRVIAWRAVVFRRDRSDSNAHGCVWAFHDLTAERQAAAALQDAENWLRMFAAHTDGIVLELDAEARFVGIWATSATFFDRSDASLQGCRLAEAVGGAQGQALEARVRSVLATGQPDEFEYVLDVRGERRVFAANAVLLSRDGEPPRVTMLIRDVTERAHMQAQLMQAERLASVGMLAAGVAHEINNPLAYVLLNLERLRSGLRQLQRRQPDGAILDLLDSVQMSLEGSRRVQEIVHKLRHFSRSDHDTPKIPVDLHRALAFALEMAAPAVQHRATMVRELGRVPKVMASEGCMWQVFLNLIMNAVQAIPEGAPERNRIRLVTRTDARGHAIVEVCDTGTGIPASALPHIFDPFFTTKAQGQGTGLGLAICHAITTSLGGEITVESEEGRGSLFRVSFPPAEETPERD